MIKAFAEDDDGNPVLMVGITQQSATKFLDGSYLGFNLAEIGHPEIFVQLRVSPDEETLIREWVAQGIIPPEAATEILEGIARNRAGKISGKVWDARE